MKIENYKLCVLNFYIKDFFHIMMKIEQQSH